MPTVDHLPPYKPCGLSPRTLLGGKRSLRRRTRRLGSRSSRLAASPDLKRWEPGRQLSLNETSMLFRVMHFGRETLNRKVSLSTEGAVRGGAVEQTLRARRVNNVASGSSRHLIPLSAHLNSSVGSLGPIRGDVPRIRVNVWRKHRTFRPHGCDVMSSATLIVPALRTLNSIRRRTSSIYYRNSPHIRLGPATAVV